MKITLINSSSLLVFLIMLHLQLEFLRPPKVGEAAVKDKMVQIWISETIGVQPIPTPACNVIEFHKLNRVGLSQYFEGKKRKKNVSEAACGTCV